MHSHIKAQLEINYISRPIFVLDCVLLVVFASRQRVGEKSQLIPSSTLQKITSQRNVKIINTGMGSLYT